MILGIDPGTERSGWVLFDEEEWRVVESGTEENARIIWKLDEETCRAVIERVDPRGMPLGNSTRDTIEWTGRFYEAASWPEWMSRRDVKVQLCGSVRAKDGNVRAEVLNRFGGSPKAAKGTKAQPGPCYGVKSHEWQALAAVIAWLERNTENGGSE